MTQPLSKAERARRKAALGKYTVREIADSLEMLPSEVRHALSRTNGGRLGRPPGKARLATVIRGADKRRVVVKRSTSRKPAKKKATRKAGRK